MQDLDEATVSGEHQHAQPIEKRAPADGKCVSGTSRSRPTESLRALEGLSLPPSTTLSSLHTALRLHWRTDRVDVSGKPLRKHKQRPYTAPVGAKVHTRRKISAYFTALHSRSGHEPSPLMRSLRSLTDSVGNTALGNYRFAPTNI